MTLLLAALSTSTKVTEEGTYWHPYIIGGGILLLLLSLMAALLAFGGGREHS